jgi:hypothetical protein
LPERLSAFIAKNHDGLGVFSGEITGGPFSASIEGKRAVSLDE